MDSLKEKLSKIPKWVWIVAGIGGVFFLFRGRSSGSAGQPSLSGASSGDAASVGTNSGADFNDVISAITSLANAQGQAYQAAQQQNAAANEKLRTDLLGVIGDALHDKGKNEVIATPTTPVTGSPVVTNPTTGKSVNSGALSGTAFLEQLGIALSAQEKDHPATVTAPPSNVVSSTTNKSGGVTTTYAPNSAGTTKIQQGDISWNVDKSGNVFKNGVYTPVTASNAKYIPTEVTSAAKAAKAG